MTSHPQALSALLRFRFGRGALSDILRAVSALLVRAASGGASDACADESCSVARDMAVRVRALRQRVLRGG